MTDDERETDDEPGADDPTALAERLRREREPFATATVVRREPPISATVGDSAVATRDGELHGWIGGLACAQSAVASEALEAIEDGESRLVGIAPDPEEIDRPGLSAHPMRCHSEGTLEVFVEPVTPTARLVVVGGTPVADTLRRLAAELPFEIVTVDPSAEASAERAASEEGGDAAPGRIEDGAVLSTVDPEAVAAVIDDRTLVVVASMGECDARGVAAGVRAGAPYVGLVASEKRAAAVVDRAADLIDRDPAEVRKSVTNPAGLDIDAGSPAEIAVSVLAETVAIANGDAFSSARKSGGDTDAAAEASDGKGGRLCGTDDAEDSSAVDPVCGMRVDPSTAPASVEHDGERYHFCCRGCADSFRADPAAYLAADESDGTAASRSVDDDAESTTRSADDESTQRGNNVGPSDTV